VKYYYESMLATYYCGSLSSNQDVTQYWVTIRGVLLWVITGDVLLWVTTGDVLLWVTNE